MQENYTCYALRENQEKRRKNEIWRRQKLEEEMREKLRNKEDKKKYKQRKSENKGKNVMLSARLIC